MKTVSYKGYQASVEFDDGRLFVKVLHIDDLLIAQCDAASEAQKAAEDLIDAYIEDCAAAGREPMKPFKGTFNVRLSPEVHRRAAMSAAEEGQTLNAWICDAVSEKIECSKLSDRIDGVFGKKEREASWMRNVVSFHMHPHEEFNRARDIEIGTWQGEDTHSYATGMLQRIVLSSAKQRHHA